MESDRTVWNGNGVDQTVEKVSLDRPNSESRYQTAMSMEFFILE